MDYLIEGVMVVKTPINVSNYLYVDKGTVSICSYWYETKYKIVGENGTWIDVDTTRVL